MRDNNMKYGFNMNILDDARSFPSLWSRTRSFINAHPELIHPDADLDWLLDNHNSGDYNNCQFFSNFEVGSLEFFRAEANEKYFDWLDKGGGFYYERFGDAPIHTLSVAMFVPKREIWFFRDIGYQHDINRYAADHKHPAFCHLSFFDFHANGYCLHLVIARLKHRTAATASPPLWTRTFTSLFRWSRRRRNRMTPASDFSWEAIGSKKKKAGVQKPRERLGEMDSVATWT